MSEDRIIIKISCDYLPIVEHFRKYVALFNNIVNFKKRHEIYLEAIQNGLLYIYRDLPTAQKYFENPMEQQGKLPDRLDKIQDNKILKALLRGNSLPQNLEVRIVVYPKEEETLIPQIVTYFTAIHEGYQFQNQTQSSVLMRIADLEAVNRYIALVLSNFFF